MKTKQAKYSIKLALGESKGFDLPEGYSHRQEIIERAKIQSAARYNGQKVSVSKVDNILIATRIL